MSTTTVFKDSYPFSEGQLKNIAFGDIISVVEGFGFRLDRVSGSYHIFVHEAIPELVNLQEVRGGSQALSDSAVSAVNRAL